MTATLKDGKLTIVISADAETPRRSASGKSLVIASTNGNVKTDVMVKGKPLTIGLNAYIQA